MKRSDVESVSTIIVNIVTILYWILSAITALVLNLQPRPIVVPGFFELGTTYKFVFYLSLFFGYIHLLRRSWETQKRRGKDVEGTFAGYLFGSVIRLKRPIVLIGFLVVLGLIGAFVGAELPLLLLIIAIVGFALTMTFFIEGSGWEGLKRRFDDDYRKHWLKRVRNKLYENGSTNTLDFLNLPSSDTDEIEWALNLYFQLYEFEQGLIFRERSYERGLRRVTVREIRFKHVPSHLPETLQ
jgi:hypothetical protein